MYRSVDVKLWADKKVAGFKPNTKLVLLYLLTNCHTHVCGMYYLTPSMIAFETGLSCRLCTRILSELVASDMLEYDSHVGIVWVRNMWKYQSGGKRMVSATLSHLDSLPDRPIVRKFRNHYKNMTLEKQDRVPDRVPDTPAAGDASKQEQKQKQYKSKFKPQPGF